MSILLFIFCVSVIFFLLVIIRWRGVDNVFLPSTFFMLFMISDAFIPLLSWIIADRVIQPSWMRSLTIDDLVLSTVYYFIFMSIFLLMLMAIERKNRLFRGNLRSFNPQRIGLILSLGCLFFGSLAVLKISLEVSMIGSVSEWLVAKSIGGNVRVSGSLMVNRTILDLIPVNSIFYSLSGLGFCLRKTIKPKLLFQVILPIFSLLISITSMLRGSVLFCLMIFVFAEYVRQRYNLESMTLRPMDKSRVGKQAAILILCIIFSMIVFGSFRDVYRSANNSTVSIAQSNSSFSVGFLTAGFGLLGVSQVVENFGDQNEYLLGRTYIDMLLLPIPRSIYTSKPVWYGIDDISRELGWPASTQTAISMPGEAFANFGISGLAVSVPFAFLFGLLVWLASRSIFSLVMLGPLVFFNTPSVTNWMGFTGFMNSILLIIFLYCLALFAEHSSTKSNKAISRRVIDSPSLISCK